MWQLYQKSKSYGYEMISRSLWTAHWPSLQLLFPTLEWPWTISCPFSHMLLIWHTRVSISFRKSTQVAQLLLQSLVSISILDYCNSWLVYLLAQFDSYKWSKNLPKFCHTTPLLHCIHWLLVAACIRFKTQVLAYKAKIWPLISRLLAPRSLRSSNTAPIISQGKRRHASRLLSVLELRRWNEHQWRLF